MKKILAVNLNPCVDYTIYVPGFKQGETNYEKKSRKDVSGKGINVCSLLKNFDMPVLLAGFDFVGGRVAVRDFLEKKNIPHVLTEVSGSLRTNFKILDPDQGTMTEINGKSESVGMESVIQMKSKICQILDGLDEGSIMTICGSAPGGVPADFYGQLIEEAKKRGILTILDTSGEMLRKGLEAKPDIAKPNRAEMEKVLGRKINTVEDGVTAAEELRSRGIDKVCLSLGSAGAVFATAEGTWYASTVKVDVRGLQGAGDAMTAAIAMRILQGDTSEALLRMAMAASQASIQMEGSQMAGPMEAASVLGSVDMRKIH